MTCLIELQHRFFGSRGFSLVELMISIVIGLIVIASAAAVFISSSQTFRTQESLAQVQETGRLLNLLFYPYVRQAGYLPDPLAQTDPVKFYVGSANPAVDVRRSIWGADDVSGIVSGVTPEPGTDVIVTRFFGQDLTKDPRDRIGQLTTCLGLPSPSTLPLVSDGLTPKYMAENVFFVESLKGADAKVAGDKGVGSLSCRASIYEVRTDGTAIVIWPTPPSKLIQPLILGVQGMQILYGVDLDADGAPNQYTPANLVTNWQQIVSVRITTSIASGSSSEVSLGDTKDAATGESRIVNGRIRRTFTTTLQIRNLLRS